MFKHGLNTVRNWFSAKRAQRLTAAALSFGIAGTFGLANMAVADEEQPEWTVTLVKHVNKAANAYNGGDYRTALSEYRVAIGINPKHEELYDGVMNAALRGKAWDQVAYAAQEIMKIDPIRRGEVAFDLGVAFYQLNRLDEAANWLKIALPYADKNFPEFKAQTKSEDIVALSQPPSEPRPVVAPQPEAPTHVAFVPQKLDTQNYLSMDTAATHSEFIGLATYEGYAKSDDIRFNEPVIAKYRIYKIIKGPPLAKDLPLRYEFHDFVNRAMPAGWKFDEKTSLPEKGSKWILFIEQAYPKNGAFETYQGSYGRQPATDDMMNKLNGILDQYNMRNATVH